MPVIRLVDLSKRLGARWALARVSLELEAGQSLLLTGENGAGKTTLLKLLATLQKPTYGHLELFGAPASPSPGLRRRIALLTHQTYLYDAQTARENLRFVARALGVDGVDSSLARVGLGENADRPVATYSAGMKRRLTLASLLVKRPQLVLLDEPWTQLDEAGSVLLDGIIGELQQAGATMVIATHDMARGKSVCDQHLTLEAGRKRGEVTAI
jgi:heme exporter protein A